MLSSSRLNYYSRLVTENQCDLRKLFSTFSKLLHQHPETRFPQHKSTALLAQEFIAFFDNKIRRIRKDLDRSTPDNVLEFRDVAAECQFTTSTFTSVSSTELTAIIGSMYLKSCDLDPIPGCIMKDCFTTVRPVITPGGGYSLKFLVGVCRPHLQIQTQFQTKKCHFPHPFSDLASKIHTRFQI